MVDLGKFTHLTFDCYGTLIDWETGILTAVGPTLNHHGIAAKEDELLRLYAKYEAEHEAAPYVPYRDVLRSVMTDLAAELGFTPTDSDLSALADSVGQWPPFSDTVEALERLKRRFKLVILSNIDDAMFAETSKRLGIEFDDVITAQQVRSYKPAPAHFHCALERLGVQQEQILHVAQSLFHDHVPAKALGLTTVWVNRGSRRPGTGVALPAEASPDLELPDLRSLAVAAGL
jgi:2-haloacid dehalogenase